MKKILAVAALTFCAGTAWAEAFPAKPVQLIVPYTPGGVTDLYARAIAADLSTRWGQSVIVDNKPGGGTVIGTSAVARAPADGYTILLTSYAFTSNQILMKELPYDPASLKPLVMMGNSNSVLFVNPRLPAANLDEIIALARTKPGALTLASSGNGSSPHIAAAMFATAADVSITHVPYKGTAPAMNDIYGGLVDGIFDGPSSMYRAHDGKLRAVAIAAEERHPFAPEVPTFRELGVDMVIGSWFGFFVPAGTPQDVQDRIYTDLREVINSPQTQEKISHGGLRFVQASPADFSAFLDKEVARLRELVEADPEQFVIQ